MCTAMSPFYICILELTRGDGSLALRLLLSSKRTAFDLQIFSPFCGGFRAIAESFVSLIGIVALGITHINQPH